MIIADIDDVAGNKTKDELDVGFVHLDVLSNLPVKSH